MDEYGRLTRTFRGGAVLALVLALGGGCAGRAAHHSEPALTCAQATDAARAALLRLSYTVTRIDAAQPGVPGTVVGERESEVSAGTLLRSGYEAVRGRNPQAGAPGAIVVDSEPAASAPTPDAAERYAATVTVTCNDAGADFTAVTNESGFTQLDFPNRFAAALRYCLDHKPAAARPDDEEAQGLVVTVEPQRGRAAASEFGVDLPSLGVTPVRIRLDNRTPRRYAFHTADVSLVTVQGARQAPLSPAEVDARLGGRSDAATVAERLRAQALHDGELEPGATLSGYLFLPVAAYQRVRVTVMDMETEEEEGVSAEF